MRALKHTFYQILKYSIRIYHLLTCLLLVISTAYILMDCCVSKVFSYLSMSTIDMLKDV